MSFGIALFVLIMQFLWLYIDDIAGKGVSVFILLELIGYLSISTFPMALPIAVLIASVMVMGNLAERYELSSMKSAGVSLLRVMRSLIAAGFAIGLFSYVCSDFIIPVSNLKFKSRLYDIRKQKPALTLEEGVFNEDFRQFVIRIGQKAGDGETIGHVMIEDQSTASRSRFNQILADSGQMYVTDNRRFFIMRLFDGVQYQEPGATNERNRQKYPFVRTSFSSMRKVWDLKEFEMNQSDEDIFKNQRSMLSMKQLRTNMDSLKQLIASQQSAIADDLAAAVKKKPEPPVKKTISRTDSLLALRRQEEIAKAKTKSAKMPAVIPQASSAPKIPLQNLAKPLEDYQNFGETFSEEELKNLRREAANRLRVAQTSLETRTIQIDARKKDFVKTGYELYTKYSFALVCIIFLFIGAPMGAIIRKGGFGYPILVSIIFFVSFIFLTILCRKFAELYILTPFWAAMLPCLLLAPIGGLLTVRAMNDSQLLSSDRFDQIGRWLRKRRASNSQNRNSETNPTAL